MAEEHAKFKRFEYRTNSNLVLQREGAGPSMNEPTGEPESLRHFNLHKMGDLARPVKDELQKALTKAKRQKGGNKVGEENPKRQKYDVKKGMTVLDADVTELQT